MIETKQIQIIADRDSICMADDVNSHRKKFEFDQNIKMFELVSYLEEDKEYKSYGGGIWAGNYDNHKCIRDNKENWIINKSMQAKEFFRGINNYLKFERNSTRC